MTALDQIRDHLDLLIEEILTDFHTTTNTITNVCSEEKNSMPTTTATTTTPPTLADRAAALIRHPDGCPADVRERTGARGVAQVICHSCGHFLFLADVLPLPDSKDLTYSARRIQHDDGCPRGRLEVKRGKLGDTLVVCVGCFKWAPLRHAPERTPEPTPTPEADTPTTAAPPPRPAAVFQVCREHHRPVSWRGTGCRMCDQERAASKRARRAKRLAATTTTTQGETR